MNPLAPLSDARHPSPCMWWHKAHRASTDRQLLDRCRGVRSWQRQQTASDWVFPEDCFEDTLIKQSLCNKQISALVQLPLDFGVLHTDYKGVASCHRLNIEARDEGRAVQLYADFKQAPAYSPHSNYTDAWHFPGT